MIITVCILAWLTVGFLATWALAWVSGDVPSTVAVFWLTVLVPIPIILLLGFAIDAVLKLDWSWMTRGKRR